MGKKVHTEKELLEIQKMQTYFIDMSNNGWGSTLEDLDEMLPCIYHLNNKDTIAIEHMNKLGCDFMDLSVEGMIEMGPSFFDEYLHPDHFKIIPKLVEFYQKDDKDAVFSYFQRVRPAGIGDFRWFFTTTKVSKQREALITISTPIHQLDTIGNKMSRILDEHSFMKKNFSKFMSLTKRELEITKLLVQGHNNNNISDLLFISTQTVKKHRKNIYQKLDINSIIELLKYAQAFDLV